MPLCSRHVGMPDFLVLPDPPSNLQILCCLVLHGKIFNAVSTAAGGGALELQPCPPPRVSSGMVGGVVFALTSRVIFHIAAAASRGTVASGARAALQPGRGVGWERKISSTGSGWWYIKEYRLGGGTASPRGRNTNRRSQHTNARRSWGNATHGDGRARRARAHVAAAQASRTQSCRGGCC